VVLRRARGHGARRRGDRRDDAPQPGSERPAGPALTRWRELPAACPEHGPRDLAAELSPHGAEQRLDALRGRRRPFLGRLLLLLGLPFGLLGGRSLLLEPLRL